MLDRDVVVRMRDGTRLMANVFRPPGERPVPAVMSVTPYGKDKLPDRIGMTFMRFAGVRLAAWNARAGPDSSRRIRCSGRRPDTRSRKRTYVATRQ